MHSLCSFSMLAGRVLLSIIFILSGVGKFVDYNSTAQYMAAKGMTMVPFFLIVAAVVELLGGLSLLLGYRTRWGAALLILYLIPVTGIFHDFWMIEDPAMRQMQVIEFLKNIAIMGGLFYVLGAGGGKWSFDACCGSHHCSSNNTNRPNMHS